MSISTNSNIVWFSWRIGGNTCKMNVNWMKTSISRGRVDEWIIWKNKRTSSGGIITEHMVFLNRPHCLHAQVQYIYNGYPW